MSEHDPDDLFDCPLSTDGLERMPQLLGSPRFVTGDRDPQRFRVRYYRRSGDGHFVGHVWFGPLCQGPPRHAHGGAVAAVLDEIMGLSCWAQGHSVVAGRLSIAYRKPVPLERWLVAEGHIDKVSGRKLTTRGRILTPQATVLADADGLFVEIDLARFEKLLGEPGT